MPTEQEQHTSVRNIIKQIQNNENLKVTPVRQLNKKNLQKICNKFGLDKTGTNKLLQSRIIDYSKSKQIKEYYNSK